MKDARLEAEKRSLFDGKKWTLDRNKNYTYQTVPEAEKKVYASPIKLEEAGIYWSNGLATWYTPTKGIKIQLSDGSWYYPWQREEEEDEEEKPKEPECQHKWVDVGVMHPKVVCYFCDKEKTE